MKITTKTNPVTLTVLLFEIMGNKTAYQAFLEHYSENDFWNETTKDFCEQVKPHRANYDAKRESIREAFFSTGEYTVEEYSEPVERFTAITAAKEILDEIAQTEGGPVAFYMEFCGRE